VVISKNKRKPKRKPRPENNIQKKKSASEQIFFKTITSLKN
jgi:hypothetical protein